VPIAAKCPSCAAPLSETSVVALAPVCSHCGAVLTNVGGTLGLTSAYGIGDPTITRKRVEADLAVLRDHQMKYRGMLEACKQQLGWGVERYAQLPHPPGLLKLEKVPPFCDGEDLVGGVIMVPMFFFFTWVASVFFCTFTSTVFLLGKGITYVVLAALSLIEWFWFVESAYFKAKAANGRKPLENARRQKAYQEACAVALQAAEPIKAAQDHRLRCQIRELEGLAKTVGEKETDVRRILATL
jgi:hypothetical protein